MSKSEIKETYSCKIYNTPINLQVNKNIRKLKIQREMKITSLLFTLNVAYFTMFQYFRYELVTIFLIFLDW